MLQHSELAIIIPAYDEALTIEAVVKSASIYGKIIVVDDSSADKTASIAAAAGALVVSHTDNRGYDCALNSGFEKASELGFSYVITFDADGQHNAEFLQEYIKCFEQDYDLVLGIRPVTARWAEYCFALYTRNRYGVRDPMCGMKGYNLKTFNRYGCFDSYKSIGTELMLYSLKSNDKMIEIKVPISKRIDKPRFGATFQANIKIIRALFIDIFK